ncbi:SCY1-like protein 2 [Liparis tanakae]|uniref:SCY1-like protein 2 n=1 Tax=Liparis tanakae TaxID=230148 RepID=A0A4Z2GT26_9TELE|nr:SCY1-like protein 2 [Liparis tanakae]
MTLTDCCEFVTCKTCHAARSGANMESMLNKLKSTVTKVTADVTSAVMGNPVTREFEVGRHIASGGPGLCWRIYNGTKKDCVAFCTEPVFASLANVLGQWDNLPSPMPTDIKEYKLYDVETKYGLLQISEGLTFLHGGPKYTCKEWEPNLPPLCLPNPEYLAPEYILSVSCDSASDMYSLGVIMHAVFNEGKPVFQVNKHDIFKSFSRQLDQLSSISPAVLNKIPEEVREHVKMLLSITPNVRPDADQMTKIPFFDDVGAVTLQYFDSLFQRDNLQKSQFYKSLPKVLPKLPKVRIRNEMFINRVS